MKIAMLGSLGNVNRVAVPELLNAGHEVTLLTSSADRVAEIEELGAHAVVGSMTNLDDLVATLTGADVAYLMLTGRATGSLVAHGEMVGNCSSKLSRQLVSSASLTSAALVPIKVPKSALFTSITSLKVCWLVCQSILRLFVQSPFTAT